MKSNKIIISVLTVVFITGILILSLLTSLAISSPETPEPTALPVIEDVFITPSYPIGYEWDASEGGGISQYEGWGGDVITCYATVTGLEADWFVYLYYGYCHESACVFGESGWGPNDDPMPGDPPRGGYRMTPEGGDLYSYEMRGDWHNRDLPTYPASNYSGIHIDGYVYALKSHLPGENVTSSWFDFGSYWPPTTINVTNNISQQTVLPNTKFWVNGSSNYWHNLNWDIDYWPDPDKIREDDFHQPAQPPCDESNVMIGFDPQEMVAETVFGPTVGGETGPFYLANGNIINCSFYLWEDEWGWEFYDEGVDYTLNHSTGQIDITVPLTANWMLIAFYNYYQIAFQGMTDADGNFSVEITAPMTPGSYILNTTVFNTTYNRLQAISIADEFQLEVIPFPIITEVAINLSQDSIYPGKIVWVNGSAEYDDGSPAISAEVNIMNVETGQYYVTSTDLNGEYTQMITTPADPDVYTIKVTVKKPAYGTEKFNTTTLTVQTPIIDVSFIPSSTTTLLSVDIWINGTATYGNGDPVALSDVNISFFETPDYWTDITDNDGAFSVKIQTPDTTGTHNLSVNITSAIYPGIHGDNSVEIRADPIPIPDLVVYDDEISFLASNGSFIEGNTIFIIANVSNGGTEIASNALVNITRNNPDMTIGSEIITLINGEYTILNVSWIAEAGNHTINVTVDPMNDIGEAFENNNMASKNLFIDVDTDGDGIGDENDTDDDNDGYSDAMEISEGSDPLDNSSTPDDFDGDYIPDSQDDDIDGDGYLNENDSFDFDDTEWNDTDDDGMGDNSDPDIDGDTIPNNQDAFPWDVNEWDDTDGDGVGDNADDDDDGDGVPDEDDAFPKDDSETADTDMDGVGDNADEDADGDGLIDDENDPYPGDTDNDGLPNSIDPDDDNDGIDDSVDEYPFDTDNDGLRNDEDDDDDGDGIPDVWEMENGLDPLDPEDARSDPDKDGTTNLEEFKAGTDPQVSDIKEITPPEAQPILVPIAIFITTVIVLFAVVLIFGSKP